MPECGCRGTGERQARATKCRSLAMAWSCFTLDDNLTQEILQRFPLSEALGFDQPGQVFILVLLVGRRELESNSLSKLNFALQRVCNRVCRMY